MVSGSYTSTATSAAVTSIVISYTHGTVRVWRDSHEVHESEAYYPSITWAPPPAPRIYAEPPRRQWNGFPRYDGAIVPLAERTPPPAPPLRPAQRRMHFASPRVQA